MIHGLPSLTEERSRHLFAGDTFKGKGCYHPSGMFGHDGFYPVTGPGEPASQINRLVGSDATRHPENDAFTSHGPVVSLTLKGRTLLGAVRHGFVLQLVLRHFLQGDGERLV